MQTMDHTQVITDEVFSVFINLLLIFLLLQYMINLVKDRVLLFLLLFLDNDRLQVHF